MSGLATEPSVFAYCSDNHPSTPGGTDLRDDGTTFTAGASGSDGAAVTLLSALAHDVHFFRVKINGIFLSTADANAVGDILVDPAGGTSWSPLVNDLACGFTGTTSTLGQGTGGGSCYEFPLYIAAGTSVGWRAKTAHTADITTGLILIEAFGEPSRPETHWCGQGVETLGVSDSKGTSITPGASGSFGSWTSVGSTTTRHFRSVQLGINGSDSAAAGKVYRFEFGSGSARLPGSPATTLSLTAAESGYRAGGGAAACNIPVGTQMQARAVCGAASPENIYVGIYGVY